MCIPRAHTPQPHLRIRLASEQAIRGRDFIRVDFIRARFDVDDDELALVLFGHERRYVALVDLIAPSRELLFAIAGL